ncbi:MAG: DnaJ domain-containing protein [Actinomycetota bacterium]|nr:DnaJ domain-containing protein [Actinomycetota bacterium]
MAAKDLYEKDYYQILGVTKNSNAAAIKKQYRKLARELHPDKTKGDKKLEDRFKAVSEAYDILSDDKKRQEYDEAREAFTSGRIPPGYAAGGAKFNAGDFGDLFGPGGDIFSSLFGGGRARHGADLQTESSITFKDSIYGTELNLRLSPQGSAPTNITTRVPAGIKDGAKIKIKGRGAPGAAGPGDLYVIVHVTPHPVFSRKDENIHLTLPITFAEATLGADISVPTLDGDEVTVRIAPGTPSGRTLRIKGRGVKKGTTSGDLMITLDVRVPQRVDGAAKKAVEEFAKATADFNPRAELFSKAKL